MTTTFWDARAAGYDQRIADHDDGFARTLARARTLIDRDARVLDFGCASGEHALELAPHVGHVLGVDISPKMIALARDKAAERDTGGVDFATLDELDPQLDYRHFDAVLALNVLHLVDDAEATVDRFERIVPRGGLLITTTPCLADRPWWFGAAIGLLQSTPWVPTIRSFHAAEVVQLIETAAFTVTDAQLWDAKNAVHWVVARRDAF